MSRLKNQVLLRILAILHAILVAGNFFVIDPRIFWPLFVIYITGIICFFTILIYSFVDYRPWYFVITICLQVVYILLAGYFASLALMGYFTIKMGLLCLVFGTNTLVIIVDVISTILIFQIRHELLNLRKIDLESRYH